MRIAGLILLIVLVAALPGFSAPVLVSGVASFTGGVFGNWEFQYSSGANDLFLQEIRIDLSGANLRFDTASGGFGFIASQDIGGFGGTDVATGLTSITPGIGAVLDGQNELTLDFDGFTPLTSPLSFHGDVDQDLSLIPLNNCAVLPLRQRPACWAANLLIGLQNDAIRLDASLVNGSEFSGVGLRLTFGGLGYVTTDVYATFENAGGNHAMAEWSGEVAPEPGTLGLLGGGLLLLSLYARRRLSR
jgi:hypothetical protein